MKYTFSVFHLGSMAVLLINFISMLLPTRFRVTFAALLFAIQLFSASVPDYFVCANAFVTDT